MAGDFGKIGVSAYAHQGMTPKNIEKLETALAAWMANEKPGSFTSRDAIGLYERALAQFSQWSGWSETRDDLEIALARLGFRAGVVVFDGEPRWILILPSSVDTALDRMAALESASA